MPIQETPAGGRPGFEDEPQPQTATTVGSPADWFHLYFPNRLFDERLDILFAGDAYHRARALAHLNPKCRFIAIHHTPRILDSLRQLKAREAIENLEVLEGGPTEIEALTARFDLIFFDSSVTQPEDLDRYLQALRSVLWPGGSLHLRVPGKYGWYGVSLLRQLAATLGIPAGAGGSEATQELVTAVTEANRGLTGEPEAAAVAADRRLLDRITQPDEAAYTVEGLLSALEGAGYHLQRFVYQAHYLPEASGLAADTRLCEDVLALPPREQWALVELFRGSMASHEVIACRSDRPATSVRIDLDAPGWLTFTPVPSPLLQSEFDHLLPGTAMRLRCRGHLYPEIGVVLDATQAVLCRSIDGRRSARDLVALLDQRESGEAVAYVQNLLKSLWKFDYVWFQTEPR